MATLKTAENEGDVGAFLDAVPDERRRQDAHRVCELMAEVTGRPPRMWGASIVGFGNRHLRYPSGRELDWFWVGFSPRKQAMTLYVMDGVEQNTDLLERLGRHRTGVACLYLRRLDDADPEVLRALLERSVATVRSEGD